MKRAVICVATTPHYQKGMARLVDAVAKFGAGASIHTWTENQSGWPPHEDVQYGFKAFALRQVADIGVGAILWADSCILPIRSMEPLWEKIEREGAWIARNGWVNYSWTADSAYPDLFPDASEDLLPQAALEAAREVNKEIPHVVATSFGLSMKHEIGRAFLAEYYRLASETRAFCGPWTNSANGLAVTPRCYPCGPADVLGHRHDQTAASVIAWRLGMKLTDTPEIFAYGKAGEPTDERTILLADGSYV